MCTSTLTLIGRLHSRLFIATTLNYNVSSYAHYFCNICQNKLVFSHSTARALFSYVSPVTNFTMHWKERERDHAASSSLFVKIPLFESQTRAHSIFYGTLANFAEARSAELVFFFSIGVIRGAASVSSSVKRDARCSEASCALAALCDNDHRVKTVSFRSF